MNVFVLFCIGFSSLHVVISTCTFPTAFEGTWESPDKGLLTINSSTILGYDVGALSNLTFSCEVSSGTQYVIRSSKFEVLSNDVNAVTCLDLTAISSNKYSYFLLTTELLVDTNVYERVRYISDTKTGITTADICNETAVASDPTETKILLKEGTATSEKVQCPDVFLAQMSYVNHTTCNESYWDGCTSVEEMRFNYNLCSELQAYSTAGLVYCVYSTTSGSTGITYVYNSDATVDNSTTYRFTCLMAESSSGYIFLSQNPGDCYKNQTTTYAPSGGKTMILQSNFPTTTTSTTPAASAEETSNAGLVAGLVVVFLILIAAAVVGGVFLYLKKFKKVEPEKKRVIDREVSNESSRAAPAVTPSVVHPDIHGTGNKASHGKLEREFTMTNRGEGTDQVDKLPLGQGGDCKLIPLESTGITPREQLSPLDTQLKKQQLPPIP